MAYLSGGVFPIVLRAVPEPEARAPFDGAMLDADGDLVLDRPKGRPSGRSFYVQKQAQVIFRRYPPKLRPVLRGEAAMEAVECWGKDLAHAFGKAQLPARSKKTIVSRSRPEERKRYGSASCFLYLPSRSSAECGASEHD